MGVNLGDVVFDDGDVFGDGVNIAARLEPLADPGGIVVSGTAYDHLKPNINVEYQPLGEQNLKNIAAPVRAYQVAGLGSPSPHPAKRAGSLRHFIAASVLALAIAGTAACWTNRPDFTPADPAAMAFKLPEKPSIAIARKSSLAAKSEDAATVAKRFGVRYLLTGPVQRQGDHLRVSAQLQDAVDGRNLWAEKWDRETKKIFELQDEIAQKILEEVQVKLTLGEQVRT
jgi:adenylate cyclase